jgi:hypothetical protein
MPYVKYRFMEEIFKNSVYISEDKIEQIEDFNKRLFFRNNVIATTIILIYYLIATFLAYKSMENPNKFFFVIILAATLTITLLLSYLRIKDTSIFKDFYKFLQFFIFLGIQIYLIVSLVLSDADYHLLMRSMYMQIFLSHFCFFVFLKFSISFSILSVVINLALIIGVHLKYKNIYYNEFFYLDLIVCGLIFFAFCVMNQEMEILIKCVNKYGDVTSLCMKYIDSLVNRMFCLFFTYTKGKVVFTNRSARDFIQNIFSNKFLDEEMQLSKI